MCTTSASTWRSGLSCAAVRPRRSAARGCRIGFSCSNESLRPQLLRKCLTTAASAMNGSTVSPTIRRACSRGCSSAANARQASSSCSSASDSAAHCFSRGPTRLKTVAGERSASAAMRSTVGVCSGHSCSGSRTPRDPPRALQQSRLQPESGPLTGRPPEGAAKPSRM